MNSFYRASPEHLIPNRNIKKAIAQYVGLSGDLGRNVNSKDKKGTTLRVKRGGVWVEAKLVEMVDDKRVIVRFVNGDKNIDDVEVTNTRVDHDSSVNVVLEDIDRQKPNLSKWINRKRLKLKDTKKMEDKLDAITCPITRQIM